MMHPIDLFVCGVLVGCTLALGLCALACCIVAGRKRPPYPGTEYDAEEPYS